LLFVKEKTIIHIRKTKGEKLNVSLIYIY